MDTSSYADVIDSRDIIARIEELESLADENGNILYENGPDIDQELTEELETLRAFAEHGESAASDWHYGAAFIRDSYFTEYAQELAEDVGAIGSDMQWPLSYIDWERAARDLRMDYTSVEYDGVTYWTR